MGDTKRTLLAGFLIALLTLCIPLYLGMIGVEMEPSVVSDDIEADETTSSFDSVDISVVPSKPASSVFVDNSNLFDFSIITNKFMASLSNVGGGSLSSFSLIDEGEKAYQYVGGYDDFGNHDEDVAVNLVLSSDPLVCSPCLREGSDAGGLVSDFFSLESVLLYKDGFSRDFSNISSGSKINLSDSDSLVVSMVGSSDFGFVNKKTVFYNNSYLIKHFYFSDNPLNAFVVWNDGLRPTEKNLIEETTYSQAFIAQNKEIEDLSFSPSSIEENVGVVSKRGLTDWVAIRNKYFINSLISKNALLGEMSARSTELSLGVFVPVYEVGLGFGNTNSVAVSQFFGPLDIDLIEESQTYLDRVMNFGWLPIQPFSRSVLWILKSLHLSGLNYGIILILFAFLIRLLTGPLTKKSFQSSQKMQTVQPKMKKIQEKYKKDPQRLNQEMVKLYKTEGVNPLGGCLPMLIQMPLLFSLFIVFRSTIEFRGAPFFWWITDLSQPDVLFYLPFYIPVYGGHVGLLPIVLGISMFLSQRLSMATMDKSQKPLMYFMTAFFFLLFNQFPSGLNLYYTIYNILNYFQQKGLKKV